MDFFLVLCTRHAQLQDIDEEGGHLILNSQQNVPIVISIVLEFL